MSTPKGMREFSLALAQQGHPLCARDNRPAKFIAYVEDITYTQQVITSLDGYIQVYQANGKYYEDNSESSFDLFLSPLGHCEGLPVFAGDKLISHYGTEYVVNMQDTPVDFEISEWPSKQPVVETRMTSDEIEKVYYDCDGGCEASRIAVANKAISRAIADGDVIPVQQIVEIMKAYKNRSLGNFEDEEVFVKNYLEGLK